MHVLGAPEQEVRTFGTTTGALLQLLDWLTAEGVAAAAMESTGVFWKPISHAELWAGSGAGNEMSFLAVAAQ